MCTKIFIKIYSKGVQFQFILTPRNIWLEMVQRLCWIWWVQKLCLLERFLLQVTALNLQTFYPSPVTLSLPHLPYTRQDENVSQIR